MSCLEVRVVCVQSGVLEEVINGAMQLAGTRLGGKTDLTHIAAVRGGIVGHFGLHLLNSIHVDVHYGTLNPVVVVVEAIDVVANTIFSATNVELLAAGTCGRSKAPCDTAPVSGGAPGHGDRPGQGQEVWT